MLRSKLKIGLILFVVANAVGAHALVISSMIEMQGMVRSKFVIHSMSFAVVPSEDSFLGIYTGESYDCDDAIQILDRQFKKALKRSVYRTLTASAHEIGVYIS